MNLSLNKTVAVGYKSGAQISRILTEDWVARNSYCPSCGNNDLTQYENNRPVADFHCAKCLQQFELKGAARPFGNKIVDGSYETMISRLQSNDNPNFFFLSYSTNNWKVNNFLIIPRHYFTPSIIEKRPPLQESARRAGWVGCNILISQIPEAGRLFLVKDSQILDRADIVQKWSRTAFLSQKDNDSKGWLIDLMNCLDRIQADSFTLDEVYSFERELQLKHPDNNHIKDKIRQQLQVLRDKGVIDFYSRGKYRKL
jgi:type II restriction enzyme